MGIQIILGKVRPLSRPHAKTHPQVLIIALTPYLVPLIDLGMWRPTYVFAAVDHAGADVSLYRGNTIRSSSIDGGGFPVHKPVTAGWSGYGDFQHTTKEAVRLNVRAVPSTLRD
ncbi:putative protein [Mycobacterium heckeshornense]|uniref:Uncharacterized protein n=1 Tax=Mycobacterium heckeshornense TaxID=110505 RepID=A0A7R7TTQ3_9MYCO|nr:hypothetical protein MHEC_13140 [Mycobacterium heckeshornense]BCQ08047.1 putative protein [Mycobacterium heckeshornense]